jgi:hypothetical protein
MLPLAKSDRVRLLVLQLALLACTPLEPQGDTPSAGGASAIDQVGLPNAPAADWSCLESLAEESALSPTGSNGRRWTYSRQVVDYVTGQPIPNVRVRACQLLDTTCDNPVAEVASAADGWMEVLLTEDFNGYFEFQSATTVPHIVFPTFLSPRSGSNVVPVPLPDPQATVALTASFGIPVDLTLGIVIIYMFNCEGVPAQGLRLSSDREGEPWYTVSGFPTFAAQATSAQGLGGFVNVSPGISVVQVERGDGTPLATPQAVLVRSGWMSTLMWDPSGSP